MVQVLNYTTIKKILIDRNFQLSYRNFANKYLSDVVWTILKKNFFPLLGLSINWNTMYTLSIPEKHIIKCWKLYLNIIIHCIRYLPTYVLPHTFSDFKGFIQILHSLIGQRQFYFYIEHIFFYLDADHPNHLPKP